MTYVRVRFAILILALAACCQPGLADDPAAGRKPPEEQAAVSRGLPAEVATAHTMTLEGEKITFTARAGAIRLRDAQSDAPQADVAYVSYERTGVDAPTRPVAFIFNGGPGAASVWLGLGAISPWRLRAAPDALSPSLPPITVENAESWLPFVDLVFIDPPGTGFSRILSDSEDLKKRLFSVQGDADALAVVVRKWLTARGRLASPRFLVGESYGGLRAAKLLRVLRERENLGVSGVVMISPALDFSWLRGARNPLSPAVYLPSFAAIARGAKDRAGVADVERYAGGDYVTDLLKGFRDAQALARMSPSVARFTGLDEKLVFRLGGRIDTKTFSRERGRATQQVLSAYDGMIAGYDPEPYAPESDWADPVLDVLRTPLGAAMTQLTIEKLKWPVGDSRYMVLNEQVAHQWDYGRNGRANAEALSDLRDALALDPHLKIQIVHGVADLVTPYFATQLMLDQLPNFGDPARVALAVIAGGHMPYIHDDARGALRDVAQRVISGK